MSGGVDSSVAALLLKRQGHEVVGLFMKNWEDDDTEDYCSSQQDLIDARAAAKVIGIELEAVNFRRPVPRTGVRQLPRRIPGRTHAESGRAVQLRDQVQGLPRPRAAPRRRQDRHRPLRAGARVPRQVPVAEGRGRHQGPELLSLSPESGAAVEDAVSRRPPLQARRAQDRGGGRPAQSRQEGFDRHLLHRRAAVPRISRALPAEAAGRDCAGSTTSA